MEWLAPPQCRKALIKASKIKTKNILRFLTNFLPSKLYPGYLGTGLACPVGWHFWDIGLMLLGCRGACFVTLPLWEQEDKSWWEKASGNPNRLPAAFRETRTKITTSRHTLQQHFTIGLFPLSVTALFFPFFFSFSWAPGGWNLPATRDSPQGIHEIKTWAEQKLSSPPEHPGSVLSLSFCFEGKFAFPLARLKAPSAEQSSWCLLSFNARQHSENIKVTTRRNSRIV